MDVLGLLKEVSGLGIDSAIVGAVILLVVRNWFSEMRREISKEIDDKVGAAKTDFNQSFKENRQEVASFRTSVEESFKENRLEVASFRTSVEESFKESRQEIAAVRTDSRQEFNGVRTYSEQSHKEIMLHLIDVRERLANIEGRLGAPTPRMSAVSPPLESTAEEPSAQS